MKSIYQLKPLCRSTLTSLLFSAILFFASHAYGAALKVENMAENPHLYSDRFAINLISSGEPIDVSRLKVPDAFNRYILYITKHREEGKLYYRFRLGFFQNEKEAWKAIELLRSQFREAWVVKVSVMERMEAINLAIVKDAQIAEVPPVVKQEVLPSVQPTVREEEKKTKAPPIGDKSDSAMMESAARLMAEASYAQALEIYKKLLGSADKEISRNARELVGVAYEKSGDLERARAEYKTYLALYPDSEGFDRVRQRVAGIETAKAVPVEKLKKQKETAKEVEVYGTFSQFYNRDESFTDIGGQVVTRSSISTDLDLNIRKRNDDYDVRAAITGGYEYSFLDSSDGETRLSQLYIDVLDRRRRLSGRVGRQSQSTGGVLGRFDGILLGYQIFSHVKANLVGGLPTESSNVKRFRTDRYFYGLNFDLGTLADKWDFNTFIINQMAGSITDRRAVGGEVRYFDTSRSFFSLVDYDIFFDTLNTAMLVGNQTFADNTTVNFSADYRKSPILTTTNALQGQSVDSINDLLKTYSESEVLAIARDRTSVRHSFMVGASRPVNKKLQVSGDFTVSEQSGTVTSGGVDGSPGTGYEYFYSLQLIGSSLIKEGDIAIAGLRFSDASTSDTVSFDINTRYPVNTSFRINPRFRTDYIYNTPRSGDVLKIRPSLRVDYYPKKWFRFELEGGGEWLYENYSGQKQESFNYFIVAGYRVDF